MLYYSILLSILTISHTVAYCTVASACYLDPGPHPHQVCLGVGEVLMHSGSLLHGGIPVSYSLRCSARIRPLLYHTPSPCYISLR